MKIFISMSAMSECINPDSFGEICVCCNACGRFDKNTQKECALNLYKKLLKEEYEFNGWIEGMEEVQKKNIEVNIEYYKKKIAEIESEVEESEVRNRN